MSLPQKLPLPKPPPKAPPPGRPVIAAPAPVAPVAAPAPQHAAPVSLPKPALNLPPRPMSTPTVDIHGLSPSMQAMMEAVRIYEDLLEEENAMLRAGNSDGVAALLDRKMSATRLYQERQRTVLGDPEATRAMSPEQRQQVVAMVRALEDLARENTILLKANMSAIEQLFEVINSAARKMRRKEVSYSEGGVIRDYHVAAQTSLAYNHTV